MSSAVKGIEEVLGRFAALEAATDNMEKPLRASGVYMLGSINRNFEAQGRPKKWKGLASSTLAARRKGNGQGSAQILIDNSDLRNSVTTERAVDVNSGGFAIGTNKDQARRLHFGYKGVKNGKKGKKTKWQRGRNPTPARPFLLFQQEDATAIQTIFSRFFNQAT